MLRKLLCKLGFHKWIISDVVDLEDGSKRVDSWCFHCDIRREQIHPSIDNDIYAEADESIFNVG